MTLVVAVAVTALLVGVSAAQETADATLQVSNSTAAAGLGLTLVEGKLRQRGKTYLVQLRGAQPSIDSTGKVYGLTQPRDIAGEYTPAGDGVRSDRGVSIVFTPPLDLPAGRLVIELNSRVYPKASAGQRGTVD